LFAFYFCGAIAAANERLEDRNGSARHRHLDGLTDMRIVIDGKDTEHGGPAGRPDAVKGLALVRLRPFDSESASISYFRCKHSGMSAP
jgi:hypothetical protein